MVIVKIFYQDKCYPVRAETIDAAKMVVAKTLDNLREGKDA
jgi:hypothetical protein